MTKREALRVLRAWAPIDETEEAVGAILRALSRQTRLERGMATMLRCLGYDEVTCTWLRAYERKAKR